MTFSHLDGDDVGFNALDKSKRRGGHGEAVFKLGGNLHRHELEKARMPQRQVTNRWLLSIVRCHLHARQVQVQRDTPLHGDLCNLVWSEGWSLFKSRSSPLNQSDRTYSWWQDCQLGSGTSLYWSQGHIREKSLPISASKVHQTHTFEHDRGSC